MGSAPVVAAGSAALDHPGGGVSAWVAIGVIALLLTLVGSLRVVPEHSRLVVSRLGRVRRVAGPGLVFRVPGLERLTAVSLHPTRLDLMASAITRDGVPVRVLATALTRVSHPQRVTGSPDQDGATATELERQLAGAVARRALASLLPHREELEQRLPAQVSEVTSAWGVEVLHVEILDIETRLTVELLRHVGQQRAAGDG